MRENAKVAPDRCRKAISEILQSYYVDDQLSCFQSVEEAVSIMSDVVRVQKLAGFTLQKFRSSNNEVVQSLVGTTDRAKELASSQGAVLGMRWDCTPGLPAVLR